MANVNNCMGIFQFSGVEGEENKRIYNTIIKPLVESHTGLTYVNATSYYEPLTIKMDLILRMIEESRLVIVNLSERNPNVFLELGIAYCLKKPMVLLCSEKSYKEEWESKIPFDLGGRELLIFKDDNDLKVQLGRFISDSLYTTKEITTSWISMNKDNHIKSPSEIEIFNAGEIWSNLGVNSNFIISYRVRVHKCNILNVNPDIRIFFSDKPNNYPRIICIFPWELSQIDPTKYECHIDYFLPGGNEPPYDKTHLRLQQVPVGKKDMATISEFDVFISFCWPNLVFESSFFENKVTRIIVPVSRFRDLGYPVHLAQYIGFESKNSRVTIENIKIKEVLV